GQDVLQVHLYGSRCGAEADCDFFVPEALGDIPQHLDLARRERHQRKVLAQALGYLGGHQTLAGVDYADRVNDLGVDRLFQDVAANAGFERAIDFLVAIVAGEGDDLGLGIDLANLFSGLDAIHPRHTQVHQRDIRTELAERIHRVAAAAGLGHQLHIRFVGQYRRDPFAYQRMVIDTKDSKSLRNGAHQIASNLP